MPRDLHTRNETAISIVSAKDEVLLTIHRTVGESANQAAFYYDNVLMSAIDAKGRYKTIAGAGPSFTSDVITEPGMQVITSGSQTANLFELYKGGTAVFVIDSTGAIVTAGNITSNSEPLHARLIVETTDTLPQVPSVVHLQVPPGTLTDHGGGVVELQWDNADYQTLMHLGAL